MPNMSLVLQYNFFKQPNTAPLLHVQVINNTGYWKPAVDNYRQGDDIAWLWDTLFAREGMGDAPEKSRSSLVGEFFVTKARIVAHPRSFYTKLLQVIHENPRKLATYSLGVLFERTWHVIFGEPAYMEGLTIAECELYECKAQAIYKDRRLML